MTIQGVRLSDGFVTDARPKNWREGTLLLFPNGRAPLYALTAGMKKKVTDDPQFHWWEKIMPTSRFALSAGAIGTGSPLNHAAGAAYQAGVRAGHVLRLEENGELVRVTTDPTSSGTTLAVTRGWAGTTATTYTVGGAGINPNVHVVGTQFEENSNAPTGVSFDPTKKTNFTQIFRNTLEMSRTAQKSRLRTGDQVREARRETLEQHSADIEKTMWFGKPLDTATINSRITRSTGGFFHYVETYAPANVVTAGATTTMADLENYLEQAFRYGSSEKVGFCGNMALLIIQRIIRLATSVSYNLQQGQKEFGMNVSRLVSPFGTVVLKTHPLWNQLVGGSTGGTAYAGLNSWLAIMDMEELVYRYLTDSDTKYEADIQANDLDGMKSGYITECGMEFHHPDAHFVLKGLKAAAAG